MGYLSSEATMNQILTKLQEDYDIYAPKLFEGEGCFSDTDSIRYGKIESMPEIVFDKKSDYSGKEILMPVSETLFYFTEDAVNVPAIPERGKVIFLRSCDLHAVKRFDEIYQNNGYEDFYYKRLREKTKFVLIGCKESFEQCFCVSMGTNKSEEYDLYITPKETGFYVESKWEEVTKLLEQSDSKPENCELAYPKENPISVQIPENLDISVMNSEMWSEYSARCIACGRCNFACPTCTCFTMQDIFYEDNEKTGERRRVWASCQVDGFTDMAGGHKYREDKGQRMRFKVLHKVYDYKKRFGYPMCIGCGRCNDICPEYISFSNCVNKLGQAMKEVEANE